MGKRLIQQRRGRNKGRFKSPSHRFKGDIKYPNDTKKHTGVVKNIIHDSGRTAVLASVELENNEKITTLAPEGIRIGDKIIFSDTKEDITRGNILPIGKIPEGIPIFNVELSHGDGGKIARSAGNNASIVSHDTASNKTTIQLPSGRFKALDSKCRATVGIIAGGGRKDKPLLKAGRKHYAFRARGKQYPTVRGVAMNPVSHPHGGGSHQHVGKPSSIKRGAPPGSKVGSIAAKRTGRK